VNCGVIIVWNDQDPETQAKRDDLRRRIEATFASTIVSEQIFFRDSVKSETELEKEMCDAVESVSKKIMKRAKLLRPVDITGGSLPKLDVPGGGMK
jgi:hypothetical protein